MPAIANQTDIYSRVLDKVFSGQLAPGSRLVERKLAEDLGVSRVPVREALMRLVAQGVLVGGDRGQGTRVRHYTPTEIRHLYQFRERIEGGAAYSAALSRSEDDIVALEMICEQMDLQQHDYNVQRWGELDHQFHQAIATASRQERFIQQIKLLLAETHFVFFNLASAKVERPEEPAGTLMSRVLQEHRDIVETIKNGDSDSAEQAARTHILPLADRATRGRIANGLQEQKTYEPQELQTDKQETKQLEYV